MTLHGNHNVTALIEPAVPGLAQHHPTAGEKP